MKFFGSRWSGLLLLLIFVNGFSPITSNARATQHNIVTTNPNSLQFGSVQVGDTSNLYEIVTNVGRNAINATGSTVSGNGFSISGLTFPLTLEPGHSITFTATFAPINGGNAVGTISLYADKGTLTIPMSGNGVQEGQLSVSPSSINFGTVNVGQSSKQGATLLANGGPVTVTAASINNSEFSASGLTFPFTLQPGQSMPFTVTFTPQQGGQATANLDFNDAPNLPTIELLAGDGNNPPPPSVTLTWNGDGNQVMGYNVFRGSKSGGPYSQLNSQVDPNTLYTDNNVSSGQTYYYVTTAVNSAGQQSAYSNQVTATIPTN